MSSVSIEEKQILFDYCIGIATQEQSAKALQLINENKEASVLYSKIVNSLKPLEKVGIESCPDYLVEQTLLRIRNIPNPNNELIELLKSEQNKKSPSKIGFLKNFTQIAAVAATLIIFTGVLVPAFGYARQRYWQQQCASSMGDVYLGLSNYLNDNDDQSPAVIRAQDAPWWKIGKAKESNSSHWYILVAQEYVKPEKFICPSSRAKVKKGRYQDYSKHCKSFSDFPERRFISYSFPILCQKKSSGKMSCRKVLMGDRNPIFESLPEDYSKTINIELKRELLHANSNNHNHSGQNILFGDGRVDFVKTRQLGTTHDDFYTLQDTDVYLGNEIPSCTTDVFLAP